jgi:hypothetical protein
MKKDAYYFPHDSNAHQDPKIISLRVKGGFEAVGIYWTIIEILRESSNYKYPHDLAMLELALSHPQTRLEPPLNQCIEVGLLLSKDGFLTSPALIDRMRSVDRRREVLRQAGRRGNEKRWSDRHPIAKRSPPDRSKVKESKVKESKVHTLVDPGEIGDENPKAEDLVDLWNKEAHPNLPRVQILTDTRKKHANARLEAHPEQSFWTELLQKINRSPLLRGENGSWKASFDWVLNPSNLAKILEGNYEPNSHR